MAFLEISGLRKRFGTLEVLKGIDLSLEKGGFLVLIGPSGCGKSTLLGTIAGLESISAGEICIEGQRINDLHPSKRDIAMVFQSYALYPNMTVAENMAFGMEMRGVPKLEREKAVAEVAKTLQLEHLLKRRPSQLSGGQRQRVAMGRALVRQPRVFLFDEPLSNLDAKLRVDMRVEIKRLHQRTGATIVYVTHDQIEAMTLATRIAVLKDGELQQVGTPHDVRDGLNVDRVRRKQNRSEKRQPRSRDQLECQQVNERGVDPVQQDVDPVVTRGALRVAQHGVVEQVGQRGDGSVEPSLEAWPPVLAAEDQSEVQLVESADARVFQDLELVVEGESGVEGIGVGEQEHGAQGENDKPVAQRSMSEI